MKGKVQTGLRIPEAQYDRIAKEAERMGVSINALILMLVEEETGSGKSALRGAVHELEKHGYLVRHLMKDENGCFAGMDYVLEAAPGGELSG